MSYSNGQTVSDVKKSVSPSAPSVAASSVNAKGDRKTETAGRDATRASSETDTASTSNASAPTGAFNTSAPAGASKTSAPAGASIANTILSSALSLLPVKNTEEVISMFESTLKDVQSGLTTARDSATALVKKYPVYSLLGAAAIGAGAALFFTMRRSSAAPSISEPIKYDA